MTVSKNFPNLPNDFEERSGFLPKTESEKRKIFFRFFVRKNRAEDKGHALYIVHGLGEQSDRFLHFPHYLQTSVDAVGLIDLPGHGKSDGTRGHIENFDDFSSAVLNGFSHFQKEVGSRSRFHWLGASMGGLITLRTMFRHPNLPLASVIVAEPQLGIAVQVPWIKELFGVLIEPLLGKIPLKNEIDVSGLSHDPSVQKTYVENPLNHSFISPRLYVNMKNEMAALNNEKGDFPYPLYLMIPLADPVVDWKKSYSFFLHLQMKAGCVKELTSFPNFLHEIFNETERFRSFTALEDWFRLRP